MEGETRGGAVPGLSRREREVLELLARGETDKEAARVIGVSVGTVRVYRQRLQTKLGTKCLVQSLLVAARLGMVDLDAITDEAMAKAAQRREALKGSGSSST